jgi:hypothetical protein
MTATLSLVLLVFGLLSSAAEQGGTTGTASTSGGCSPAITGNNNQVAISCSGMSKEQAAKVSALLNEISRRQIDPQKLMDELGEISSKIPKLRGVLIPASDPDPDPSCKASSGDLKLVMGTWTLVNPLSDKVIVIGSRDWIAVHRLGTGIGVDADLTSEDGKILVQVRNNQFVVNPNNTFNVTGDDSTLIVHDNYGVEVLNVRFANETAVRINAVFNPVPGVRIEFTERGLKTTGTQARLTLKHACSHNSGGMTFPVPEQQN